MARPTRITVASGNSVTLPVDYFGVNFAIAVYPTGGATGTVTYSIDDCNGAAGNPAIVFFALPAPLAAGVSSNTVGNFSLTVARGLKFATTVAGSCDYVLVQPSGAGGIA